MCFSGVVSCSVCSTNVAAHDALLLDNRLSARVKRERERDGTLACGLHFVVIVVVVVVVVVVVGIII